MILHGIFGTLAGLGLALTFWQWLAAIRFPLHRRAANPASAPGVTLLKPLKGCDEFTETCLRSWFAQEYPGEIEIIFGVAKADDPVCAVVEKLLREFPKRAARLKVCENLSGANAKVSKLAQMEREAKHEIIVISDADVLVPRDLLANVAGPLTQAKDRTAKAVGLVNCFYWLANPSTLAMHWEAVAINGDFWSQVLQSRSLKPLDFALGAVMATRREYLAQIGGFAALENCLADDYQLGHRIAGQGHPIELCPVVAECWSAPMSWRGVWKHQLRWARTIRVCQPLPYFFSILSNATLWALIFGICGLSRMSLQLDAGRNDMMWVACIPGAVSFGSLILAIRIILGIDLQRRLERGWKRATIYFWMVPVKDLLQAALWLGAFAGSTVEWRGQKFRVKRDGTLEKAEKF